MNILNLFFPRSEQIPVFYRKPDFHKTEPDAKLTFSAWSKYIYRKARKVEIDAELLVNRRINDGEKIPSFTDCSKWRF